MVYTTIDYFLLIFFDFGLFSLDSELLNCFIIFSASTVVIFFEVNFILDLIKSKIKLENKTVSTKEAEKIISEFNQPKTDKTDKSKTTTASKIKAKSKKISKK